MPYNLPKPMWFVLIILFPLLGAIAWIALLRIARAEAGQEAPSPRDLAQKLGDLRERQQQAQRQPEHPKRPLGPDDDPEYLARLDRELRRREVEREREQRKQEQRRNNAENQGDATHEDSDKHDGEGHAGKGDLA